MRVSLLFENTWRVLQEVEKHYYFVYIDMCNDSNRIAGLRYM
jgi:hypothetical protein